MAMPDPIIKSEIIYTGYVGKVPKSNEPKKARKKEQIKTLFSPYFSSNIPAGIDIGPYAIKNAKGINPTRASLKSNVLFISGLSGLRILVKNEIIKNTK